MIIKGDNCIFILERVILKASSPKKKKATILKGDNDCKLKHYLKKMAQQNMRIKDSI